MEENFAPLSLSKANSRAGLGGGGVVKRQGEGGGGDD